MEAAVAVLIFVAICFINVMLGVAMDRWFVFDKLDEVLTEASEALSDTPEDKLYERLTFYKGYVYAIKLISVRLGLKYSETDDEKEAPNDT